MTRRRSRLGPLAWVLTLQFFVIETIAQLRYDGPYSRVDDVISELGAATSPAHALMNASFLAQGVLIATGALLLGPALPGASGRVARLLLAAAAGGVVLVGVFPLDGNAGLHAAGAGLHLVGGGLGLLALAGSVRQRSAALGTTLAVLGLAGILATILFGSGFTWLLGEGGTERVAAYVVPLGLPLTGLVLGRTGAR